MSKQNTKAGAIQVSQYMAALEEAKQQAATDTVVAGSTDIAVTLPVDTTTPATPLADTAVANTTAPEPAAVVEPVQDLVVEPVVVLEPTPVEKVVVIEAEEPKAENATMQEKLNVILKSVPPAYQIDINRVLVYLEKMAPKRPVLQAVGAKEQLGLYKAIQNIINRQDQYFTQLFSALLFIFKSEMKGALGDRYRLRFLESVELPTGDRKAFNNLTHLLYVAADPATRQKALETVNMERALENGLTAEGRDRVLRFFNA